MKRFTQLRISRLGEPLASGHRLYDAQAALMPFFTQYAIDAAPREIPVFRLARS